MNNTRHLIDKLYHEQNLSKEEFVELISYCSSSDAQYLFKKARHRAIEAYGHNIYIRGLIEVSNICKNDCFYCGIRRSNPAIQRYRLTKEQILDCCKEGYRLGFRTFVLQGGEDGYFTDDVLCDIVSSIKNMYKTCAITLSLGERSKESYQKLYNAGADRYLLRHETATPWHYNKLHPNEMVFENRIRCLYNLKEIGFQVGCGFMVGSPFQTIETIADDLLFIKAFNPHMVGIGPFIPQKDTPFGNEKAGTADMTLMLLAIIRLMLPTVLLPATTALGTIDKNGRQMGIFAGANVVMPNLSPFDVRKNYALYDNKAFVDAEAAENLASLKKLVDEIGYKVVISRGDFRK